MVSAFEVDSPVEKWIDDFPVDRAKNRVVAAAMASLPPWSDAEYERAVATLDLRPILNDMWRNRP